MSFLLNKRIILITGTFVLVFSFLVNPLLLLAQTQFNQQINYQGKLTNSAGVAVPNGTYNMKFWLIASSTAATSSAVWSETRTGGDRVQVTNGLFSVMLGEVSPLSSVDFNKTLYLGVEIGATNTTPVWDGEMSPRKILGAVPAAFEAKNAQTLGGIATTSFLRSDQIDTMEATSSSALLTLIQNGTGKILSLFSGVTEMFTILSNGNVGIASSTPSQKLTVIGNSYLNGSLQLTGAFKDSTNATGTLGMILKTTGTSTQWVATSSLGLGNGTFLGLTDTPSSFTANSIMFTNSGATALTDSANLTFDGTNLGLGSQNGVAFGSIRYLYASSTNDSLVFGENAGSTFNSGTAYNTAMGFEAGRYASSTFTDYSNLIGYQAGYNNDGSFNNLIGSGSGYNNTGWYNNIIGSDAGFNNVGDNNNLIGDEAGYQNSGSGNEMIGFGAGRNLQSTSSVVIGGEAYRGGAGSTAFQAVNNVAIGYRAGYSAQTGASNNILVGYKAADNITTGSNNIVIGYDVDIASTTRSNQLNIGNLIFGTGLNGTGTALSSGNIGIGTTTPGSKLTVVGDVDIINTANDSAAITLRDTIGNVSLEIKAGTSTLENILIGVASGQFITTGSNNAALGAGTLYYNTTGSNNTALGWQSLFQNATGSNNTASGFRALYANVGSDNTAYGTYALAGNTTGTENTASGLSSLISNTIGSYNTAYGTYALAGNTTGNSNTAIGYASLQANVAGDYNTALGLNAGFDIDTATGTGANTLIGHNTGRGIVTGVNNTILGANVTGLSSTLSNNIIIADGAGNRRINVDGSGNVGIGTTTPVSLLAMEKITFTGAGIAGINQYLKSTNSTASAVQYGNFGYLYASNTATTTITGNMFKIEDNTTFGNTTRGFEVQTDIGTNTLGENTALSGFARTFGVRGTTKGNAGITYEPAGVFGETQGTTQGNAIRGYSSTITSASLLKLFQDSSTFTGTGLLMNFGNSGGSFSSTTASKFIDLQNAGTSMFTVGAYGALRIGDGTTGHNAGIQVGYGGICVDNDGSCNASTTGRVSAVSYHTGNSDLAETYFSNENLKTGEVVYIKGGLSVGRATEINKDKIIGVVSTKPGLLLGFDDTSLNKREKSYPIALKGRVPVRLSNENGDIKAGDELMLSSLAGVVMKATSTGMVVGVALEDFNGDRAYSDTYINQFGDDLVDPVFEPINKDNDPRINDGCYFGGGRASGEEVCIPLVSTTTDGRIAEAEALARRDAEEKALAKLASISGERINLDNGREVEVGQIVMFVDLRNRTLDEFGVEIINSLMSKASSSDEFETETIWQRLVQLANNFIGGVLSVFTLEADRVEVKDQLCVDGVCVTGEDLRELLKKENESSQINSIINNGVNNSEEVRIDEVENNISNLNNENQLPLDIQNPEEVISISEEILSETEAKVDNNNLKTEVDSPIIIIDNKETPTGVNIVGEVNIENIENVIGS